MKAATLGLAAIFATGLSLPASAATVTVTSSNPNNPTRSSSVLAPVTSDGTSAAGSFDVLMSKPATSTRYFSIDYLFTAPFTGAGNFEFVTTSTSPAMLQILGFAVNGIATTFTQNTGTTTGSTSYAGSAPVNLTQGQTGTFTVFGSVLRSGSIGTTVSFASAVPEISTWLMMIIGIGFVGGAMRSRRRTVVRYQFA